MLSAEAEAIPQAVHLSAQREYGHSDRGRYAHIELVKILEEELRRKLQLTRTIQQAICARFYAKCSGVR